MSSSYAAFSTTSYDNGGMFRMFEHEQNSGLTKLSTIITVRMCGFCAAVATTCIYQYDIRCLNNTV